MILNKHEQRIVMTMRHNDYGRKWAIDAIRGAKCTRDLERMVTNLPMFGAGWRTANYRTTLERAISDRKEVIINYGTKSNTTS